MKRSTLGKIYTVPVIGYVLRSAAFIFTIPRQQNKIIHLNGLVESSANEQHDLKAELSKSKKDFESKSTQLVVTVERLNQAIEISEDLQHQVRMLQKNNADQLSVSASGRAKTLADNHLLDKFYVNFEDAFRGTEDAIYKRLKIHLPRIKKLSKLRGRPLDILDIGCGRAEFLKLMKENGHKPKGLDLNTMMVKRAQENGFDIVEEDALSYLLKQKSNSLDIISGFHIVEHIPFDELITIFKECHRVLKSGGFTLFETPNPENVTVGSWRFYYDPSHLHPLPPDMLAFAMQTAGFEKTEVMRLSPEIEPPSSLGELEQKIHSRLFGPLEYALIAEK